MSETEAPAVVTFTQEDMDKLAGRVKAEAARKAAADKEAEILSYLDAQKAEADRANLDEIDRVKAERDEAIASAAAATSAVEAIRAEAAATSALHAAGLTASAADALKLVDIAAEDIAAEVASLKERLPALFASEAPAPQAPAVPPAGGQHSHTGGKTAQQSAQDRFAAMFPNRTNAA